jgi:3-dehydroquinate dehydratase II
MNPNIHIINGPNLNWVGVRETNIYGSKNLEVYLIQLNINYPQLNIHLYQSNNEGEIVDYLQTIYTNCDGIIINPAAYTHTSIAIRDALSLYKGPIVEIHISNISTREEFRHPSFIRELSWSHIEGYGIAGYKIAVERMLELIIQS